ncbi:hypothetical protein N0V90_002898 [Kalmusia sp. IMI 367209]|nr:hypothetical protein N0V90_002898 [Kalmusia sp. IMI 367209]
MNGKASGRRKRKASSPASEEHTPSNGNNHLQQSVPNRASPSPPPASLSDRPHQTQRRRLTGNGLASPLSFTNRHQWALIDIIRDQASVIAAFHADVATVLDAWQASLVSNGNSTGPHELVGHLMNAHYFTRYMAALHPYPQRNGPTNYQTAPVQQTQQSMTFDSHNGHGARQPIHYNHAPQAQSNFAAPAMARGQNGRIHVEMDVVDKSSLDLAPAVATYSSVSQDQQDQVEMMDPRSSRAMNGITAFGPGEMMTQYMQATMAETSWE